MQVADVSKALASVARLVDAGNNVFFSSSGSYIENAKTKTRTKLTRENNVFVFDLLVDVPASVKAAASGFTRPR